jgi:hypothetical protein
MQVRFGYDPNDAAITSKLDSSRRFLIEPSRISARSMTEHIGDQNTRMAITAVIRALEKTNAAVAHLAKREGVGINLDKYA